MRCVTCFLAAIRLAAISAAIGATAAAAWAAEQEQAGDGRATVLAQSEKPGVAEKSSLTDESFATTRGSLFARLLTWPKKDDDKDEGDEKEPPLESDRPDFTESPTTVGLGRLQIESGYLYTHGKSGDRTANTHELPQLLLRYGVAERLELRFYCDGIVLDSHTQHHSGRLIEENGISDTEFGFKYALTKQNGWRPQTAVIVAVTAPTGSPSQTSGQVDPVFGYFYGWELTKKLSMDGGTRATWTGENGDRFSELQQSLSVNYELTEPLHVFGELVGIFHHNADDSRPQDYFDGGVTYLVTPNVQLDWSAGVGLSAAADRFFTGCGITVRR